MPSNEDRARCEELAERGVERAAYLHESQIQGDTLRFIDALLASPTGCATLDDATEDLQAMYADGGKWRASIPRRLRAAGLIVADTVEKSCRLSRHAGYLTRWRLIDRTAAERYRAQLWAALRKDAGESTAIDSPAAHSTVDSLPTAKQPEEPTPGIVPGNGREDICE